MDRGRAQPAEGLTVISVTAGEEVERRGRGRERKREGKTATERRDGQSPNWKSGIYYMVETTACAGEPLHHHHHHPLCLSVSIAAQAPTDHLIQTDDTDARKRHRNTTDYPSVQLKLAETNVLIKQETVYTSRCTV